ncbi:MAG: RNA recognition motif domain-containing protein, partial [Planctomycetota bacterium]
MKIFVGNLSGQTTEDDLRHAFESFGQVRSVTIVTDAGAGESRGFGFVIMSSASEAKNAIEEMNGEDLRGQKIKVEKSRTKAKARSGRRRRS